MNKCRKKIKHSFLLTALILTAAFPLSADNGGNVTIGKDLRLNRIADSVWIHVSSMEIPRWGTVQANGLAVQSGERLILIDTPWNDDQTRRIVEWFKANRGCTQVSAIVCHYHEDNLGGLAWINRQGYESYSYEKTIGICKANNLPVPRTGVASPHSFRFGDLQLTLFFPGEGHTVDAACVYLPAERILFAGCSVKALNNKTLGNTAEANLEAWPESLLLMKTTFASARIVVPGHGKEGDLSLIDHTLSLF